MIVQSIHNTPLLLTETVGRLPVSEWVTTSGWGGIDPCCYHGGRLIRWLGPAWTVRHRRWNQVLYERSFGERSTVGGFPVSKLIDMAFPTDSMMYSDSIREGSSDTFYDSRYPFISLSVVSNHHLLPLLEIPVLRSVIMIQLLLFLSILY